MENRKKIKFQEKYIPNKIQKKREINTERQEEKRQKRSTTIAEKKTIKVYNINGLNWIM